MCHNQTISPMNTEQTYPKDVTLIRVVNQELDHFVYQEIEYYEQHRLWVKGGQKGPKPHPPELPALTRQALKDCQQYYGKRTPDEAFEKEQLQYRELIIMNRRLEDAERKCSRKLAVIEQQQELIERLRSENERLRELAEGLRKLSRFYADGSQIQNFLN